MARPKQRVLHLVKIIVQRHADMKRAAGKTGRDTCDYRDGPEDGFLEATGEEIIGEGGSRDDDEPGLSPCDTGYWPGIFECGNCHC